jgi:hypothetical protein
VHDQCQRHDRMGLEQDLGSVKLETASPLRAMSRNLVVE